MLFDWWSEAGRTADLPLFRLADCRLIGTKSTVTAIYPDEHRHPLAGAGQSRRSHLDAWSSDLYGWRHRMWEKHIGVLPVSWTEHGDEWQFHLANALSDLDHLGGRGASMGGGDVILDPPPMSGMQCSLRI